MRKVVSVLVLMCILLSGCYRQGSLGQTELYYAAAIVSVGVPNGFTPDKAFDEVELLETDAYGRELLQYRNDLYTFLIICQKTQAPLVYYYEDVCYLIRITDSDVFNKDQIDWLKEVNDWDCALNDSKMRVIDYMNLPKDVEDRQSVEAKIRRLLGLNKDTSILLDGLETDADGNKLIYVVTYDSLHGNANYLVLCGWSGNQCNIVALESLDEGIDHRESIIDFKQAHFISIQPEGQSADFSVN